MNAVYQQASREVDLIEIESGVVLAKGWSGRMEREWLIGRGMQLHERHNF
jgi:hypothetical protein